MLRHHKWIAMVLSNVENGHNVAVMECRGDLVAVEERLVALGLLNMSRGRDRNGHRTMQQRIVGKVNIDIRGCAYALLEAVPAVEDDIRSQGKRSFRRVVNAISSISAGTHQGKVGFPCALIGPGPERD